MGKLNSRVEIISDRIGKLEDKVISYTQSKHERANRLNNNKQILTGLQNNNKTSDSCII